LPKTVIEVDRRVPSHGLEAAGVDTLAEHTVRSRGVETEGPVEAGQATDPFREILDRDLKAAPDINGSSV
jgi:hypothetical protein